MPGTGPMTFSECMLRSWPGISDKEAFCAAMHRGELAKIVDTEKLAALKKQLGPNGEFALSFPIVKRDDAKRVVTGWAAISRDASGQPLIDYHGDHMPAEDLEKAVHDLMRAGGGDKAGEMHERRVGDIVEAMVVSAEKRQALGFGEGPEGIVVSMKIADDSAWAKVLAGELRELSISGIGERISVGV